MAEIKEKIILPGGVEITHSSNAFVQGELNQWKAQVGGVNNIVVDSEAIPASPSKLLLNTPSPTSNETPVASTLTVVKSFDENPSGLGYVLRFERLKDMKKHKDHKLKAA